MMFRLKVIVFAGLSIVLLSLVSVLVYTANLPKLPNNVSKDVLPFSYSKSLVPKESQILQRLDYAQNQAEEENIVPPEATKTKPESIRKPSTPRKKSVSVSFPININTASKEELMALPGVGEVLAERIIALRKELGEYNSVEDLLKVKGIGEKKLEKIRPLVYVK